LKEIWLTQEKLLNIPGREIELNSLENEESNLLEYLEDLMSINIPDIPMVAKYDFSINKNRIFFS
jgi:hypothetical protein